MRSGLGRQKNRPTRIGAPRSQTRGERMAVMRPPSKGEMGIRLKRLRKKPA
jgi:hypothetical protein